MSAARIATNLTALPSVSSTARGAPVAAGIYGLTNKAHAHAGHHDGGYTHGYSGPASRFASKSTLLNGVTSGRTLTSSLPSFGAKRLMSTTALARRSTDIPDFEPVLHNTSEEKSRAFAYFLVGSMGAISAAGAESTVTDLVTTLSASRDVLALAKVEVDLSQISLGSNLIVKWRGKPVFIRHRTEDEVKEAENIDVSSLRDPESDKDRVQKPEWLVMLGICTHLGCVPIGDAGDYGGWFCPCHGSHYDISGRIRRGPAPLNLEVPEYSFESDEKLILG